MKPRTFNPYILIAAVLAVSLLFGIGLHRLKIDTDIIDYLPEDPVIQDALHVFKNHQIQDQVFIDLFLEKGGPDRLVAYGKMLEQRLRAGGLFNTVGLQDLKKSGPALAAFVTRNLPLMFTEEELREQVEPLIEPEAIRRRLSQLRQDLMNLDGIGQAGFIEMDPLGLRNLVLARLASLNPSQDASFYGERLVSSDGRHLLVIANPVSSGTDTLFSRKMVDLMDDIARSLNQEASKRAERVAITPVGAYRAALDNELIIRGDVKKAILFATLGIALLLILAFPRPYMGLLSLLPSIVGTMSAFFIFSLLHESISIMVLGFGGAIISITVDHGLAYLLFLDRPQWTAGRDASHEVRSVGLLALLTTVGAFEGLTLSGFPILRQLGQFTVLGISLSFIFVHSVFPLIFPAMPPARPRALPLRNLVDRPARFGRKGAAVALCLLLVMAFFARPRFSIDLSSMNTVTRETAAAERLISSVWGDMQNKVFLMVKAESRDELERKQDHLLEMVDRDLSSGALSSGFVPSMIFPGEERRDENAAAWKRFWSGSRVSALNEAVKRACSETGFEAAAFEPFYRILEPSWKPEGEFKIPEDFYPFVGMKKSSDRAGWIQMTTFTTGDSFDSERFYADYRGLGSVFDPALFSKRLGNLLLMTFLKMLAVIGAGVVVLLLLFFLDLRLTIVSLLPVVFSIVCTLGTLNILGRSLDISTLMLSIVAIGMGIDYSLFFVRSYQRYGDPHHPSFNLIRTTVFMAAATTIIGFCSLCFAEHSLLKSAGLSSTLAIGYALVGAFLIVPPAMEFILRDRGEGRGKGRSPAEKVLERYRNMETYPRMFARFKLLLDPMFKELPDLLSACKKRVETVMDVGSGYGVPACWLLERFPGSRVYGIDPDPERVGIARRAIGNRGLITRGRAPGLPETPAPVDIAFMLDMIHYLDDEELGLTLRRLQKAVSRDGIVIIRMALEPERRFPWIWWLENIKLKIRRIRACYRSLDEISRMITYAGFVIERSEVSGNKEELIWLVLRNGS